MTDCLIDVVSTRDLLTSEDRSLRTSSRLPSTSPLRRRTTLDALGRASFRTTSPPDTITTGRRTPPTDSTTTRGISPEVGRPLTSLGTFYLLGPRSGSNRFDNSTFYFWYIKSQPKVFLHFLFPFGQMTLDPLRSGSDNGLLSQMSLRALHLTEPSQLKYSP